MQKNGKFTKEKLMDICVEASLQPLCWNESRSFTLFLYKLEFLIINPIFNIWLRQVPKHNLARTIQVSAMKPLVGIISVYLGSDSLFVNKYQDISPTEQDCVGNTYDVDEVSPNISYGDYQNQVSAVISRISPLLFYQITRPKPRIILMFSLIISR